MACRALTKPQRLSLLTKSPTTAQSPFNSPLLPFLAPSIFHRSASSSSKTWKKSEAPSKKKKERKTFKRNPVDESQKFALCDAIRYLRAFEVGRVPTSSKFELHVSFRTQRNGPVVRNRMRLPYAVSTSQKIAVICPPDSEAAEAAKQAGAVLVGEDVILDAVKEGRIEFEQLICHQDSAQKLNKAGVGRILGPKGLMPSSKTGTMVRNVGATIKGMVGGTDYRERMGVVRLAIGQLAFTPEQMQANIKAFMANLKKDLETLSDKISKDIHEVVLSSTNGPGFSLNGDFRSPDSLPTKDLSVP